MSGTSNGVVLARDISSRGKTGVAVVIPVWNEEASIGGVIDRIPRYAVDEIIIGDGGSQDHTVEIAEAKGARVIHAGRGYGRACFEAAKAAGPASDIIVIMDGDGSDFPEELPKLVAPIRAGERDFVIASRVRGERQRGSMGWHQVVGGRLIGGAIGALYGVRYTDMCAFRAIRRDALAALDMREMTYGWNLEMQMKAARAGLRILEIPVPYGVRTGGRSKVAGSLGGTIRAGRQIIATFARVVLSRR
jgi:glycosyltransferase involved in cell wall biosynthesis